MTLTLSRNNKKMLSSYCTLFFILPLLAYSNAQDLSDTQNSTTGMKKSEERFGALLFRTANEESFDKKESNNGVRTSFLHFIS